MVGEAVDYASVLEEAARLVPDVVIMDIKLPPTHSIEGIDAAHLIKRRRPETGVVVLSQHDDEEYVWSLLSEGVAGLAYLHKVRLADVDQLLRAIREVAVGGSVLDPHILETLLSRRAQKPGSALNRLSPAELDVLRLMADGRSNNAIAEALTVSIGTVEKRVGVIFDKVGIYDGPDVNRRVAAVLIYLKESAPGR